MHEELFLGAFFSEDTRALLQAALPKDAAGLPGISIAIPHSKAGRMVPLAVTSARRAPQIPEVPTIDEAGVPGYDVRSWYGLLATAGTPPVIVKQLNTEVVKILGSNDVKAYFSANGLNAVSNSPAEFSAYIKSEYEKWARVIKQANLRTDS